MRETPASPSSACWRADERLGLFGYGSLVLHESASMTLGPARRRATTVRGCTTGGGASPSAATTSPARRPSSATAGWRPEWILGLNVEEGEDEAGPVNGVVIELTEAELDRLDIREIRYDRVDVTGSVEGEDLPERIVTYTAKPFHFAPEPPGGRGDPRHLRGGGGDAGSRRSGPGELEHYRATTPYPVDRVEAELVIDRIPAGNPRAW